MKRLKKLISSILVVALIFSSPVLMDHARDIYLVNVVAPKANPVKIEGNRTIGSSFQLSYKDTTVTVTNHHVCSVVAELARRKDIIRLQEFITGLVVTGRLSVEQAKKLYYRKFFKLMTKKYPIVGEYLKIGQINRKILHLSKSHDICFLEPTGGRTFSLASRVDNGERISIIGHPRGVSQSISDGRVVGKVLKKFRWIPDAGYVTALRSTALSYPGNSGSPVVNRYGNVVGILFAGTSVNYINLNLVVPLEYIKAEIESYERISTK